MYVHMLHCVRRVKLHPPFSWPLSCWRRLRGLFYAPAPTRTEAIGRQLLPDQLHHPASLTQSAGSIGCRLEDSRTFEKESAAKYASLCC